MCLKQSRYTSEALHGYLSARAEKGELLTDFLEALLQQFATHQKVDRITLPLIKTVGDLLSSSAVLDSVSLYFGLGQSKPRMFYKSLVG